MGGKQIAINHFTVLKNFMKGKKTFGESLNLQKLIEKMLTQNEFNNLKAS